MLLLTFPICLYAVAALRPNLPQSDAAIDSEALASAVASLSALSNQSRSSPAQSLAVLGTANQIVSGLAEAPPSLTEETIEALNQVIKLIQQTVYSEMDVGHQSDKDSLATAAAAASSCNAALQTSISGDGTIAAAEQHSLQQQVAYRSAKEGEEQKEQLKTEAQDAFNAHMGAIQPLPTCSTFPTNQAEQAWTNYFNTPPDLDSFNFQKAAYDVKKQAYHDALKDLEDANDDFASSKGALEESYCNMGVSMTTGCNELISCYSAALEEMEVVEAKARANMKLRKEAHAAGEAATQHLRLILGLDASVPDPEPRYHLDIPIVEPQGSCSVAAMVAKQNWEDFLDMSNCNLPVSLLAQGGIGIDAFDVGASGCSENAAGEISCNRGQVLVSHDVVARPLKITAEIMSFPNSECISMTFAAGGNGKNDGISHEIGGWAHKFRLFPHDRQGNSGNVNNDWHLVSLVLDDADGVEFWLHDQMIFRTTSHLSSGHIRFVPGCTNMRIRNIRMEA